MRYGSLKKEIPHLHSFLTAHPEVSEKVDTLLSAPVKLTEKMATLNGALEKEST